MKKVRLVITAVLMLLGVLAWIAQASNAIGNQKKYNAIMAEAEARTKDGLYQQAIETYEKAMKIMDTEDAREKWIAVYELAYQDGVVTQKDFANALLSRCEKHPKEAAYWEQLIELYYSGESYKKAHEILEKSEKAGASSDRLTELSDAIMYSYTNKGKLYADYFRSPEGYYTVFDSRNWGVMNPDGEWLHERNYYYASPTGLSCETALQTSRDIRVIDAKGVVQAILEFEYEQMRAVGAGLIPVRTAEGWQYYDYAAKKTVLQGYEDASAFVDDKAAVKKNGTWTLIRRDGTAIDAVRFDDIKLYMSGEYAYENVMVASVNGRYGIYDASGTTLCELNCQNADCFYGEAIAYQDQSGKWGYVTKTGETVLEPRYEAAKSFSNGLAAVRVEGKWGFIDKTGKQVIPCQYQDADYFTKGGLAMVMQLEEQYYMIELRFPQ